MSSTKKTEEAYKTISEVTKELNLIDQKTGHLQTHTIRYWETQFKQIKPKIMAGKRRYYSSKDLKTIKYIKFLLKDKGLTIIGARKILAESKTHLLDGNINLGVYNHVSKKDNVIKNKIKKISNIIKELKKFK
jgi:DNA-binding transcriptional MerR regulator